MLKSQVGGEYGAIILAAGASTRMGSAKQLLPWKNKNLLQHVMDELRISGIEAIAVVLGASGDKIDSQIEFGEVDRVFNAQWEGGMASSIVTGMKHLLEKFPSMRGVLIALADQPLLDHHFFNQLRNMHTENRNRIIASFYSGEMGVPALFDKRFFNELLDLRGEQGAKALLRHHESHVIRINAGDKAIDLDTKEKYDYFYDLYGRP
jgi:molybdenum cofactor cytidylyltransferase